MRRKFIAAITVLLMILTAAATGVGAQVTTDTSESVVTVSGTAASGETGVNIGIDVFCPGMGYKDLEAVPTAEFARVIALRDQAVSGDGGKWELSFKIVDNPEWDFDARSGNYTIYIFPEDSDKAYTETFMYVNLNEAEKAVEILRAAQSGEIAELLDRYRYELGIGYEFYDMLDKGKLADMVYSEIKNGVLDNIPAADGVKLVCKAVLIEALNEGRLSSVFEYEKILGLDRCDIAPYCQKKYVRANDAKIASALKGAGMKSFSDFNEKLTEATVLSVVKNPDGEGNVKEITEAFADKIGFDAPLADSAYRAVMGNTYESFGTLASALKSANNKPSGGGSGGGAGGSGGGFGSAAPTVAVAAEKEAVPMYMDIFEDIDDVSWAKDAIIYLAQKGIVNGKADGRFYPNDTVTREEAAKILVLAFAAESEEADISFDDVSADCWYRTYVAKAVKAGIVKGCSETRFGSGENITREDLVTMIYRAAVNNGINLETGQLSFSDSSEIADYAAEAVGALAKAEIVSGSDFQTFAPKSPATRAETAKIIYRLLDM